MSYHDIDGSPCTLDKLCRTQPAWAATRIRAMTDSLSAVFDAVSGMTPSDSRDRLIQALSIAHPPAKGPPPPRVPATGTLADIRRAVSLAGACSILEYQSEVWVFVQQAADCSGELGHDDCDYERRAHCPPSLVELQQAVDQVRPAGVPVTVALSTDLNDIVAKIAHVAARQADARGHARGRARGAEEGHAAGLAEGRAGRRRAALRRWFAALTEVVR